MKLRILNSIKDHNFTFPEILRVHLWYKLMNSPQLDIMNLTNPTKNDRAVVEYILVISKDKSGCVLGSREFEREIFQIYKNIKELFFYDEKEIEVLNSEMKSGDKKISTSDEDKNEMELKQDSKHAINDEKTATECINKNDKKSQKEQETHVHGSKNDEKERTKLKNSINDKEIQDLNKEIDKEISDNDVFLIKSIASKVSKKPKQGHLSNEDKALIRLIDYVVRLKNSNQILAYRIIYVFFDKLKFIDILKNKIYRDFITLSLKNNIFDMIMDVAVCYGPFAFEEILDYIEQKSTGNADKKTNELENKLNNKFDDPENNATHKENNEVYEHEIDGRAIKMYEYIRRDTSKKLLEIQKSLKIQEIDALIVSDKAEEEYFDFLVVQNEMVKAEECVKKEMVDKMEELSKLNTDLIIKNNNLKENLATMESEMVDFKEKYMAEMTKVINDLKIRNEELEKELAKNK